MPELLIGTNRHQKLIVVECPDKLTTEKVHEVLFNSPLLGETRKYYLMIAINKQKRQIESSEEWLKRAEDLARTFSEQTQRKVGSYVG